MTNHEGHKRLWNRLAITGDEFKDIALYDEFEKELENKDFKIPHS
jgi:hypothetical protein